MYIHSKFSALLLVQCIYTNKRNYVHAVIIIYLQLLVINKLTAYTMSPITLIMVVLVPINEILHTMNPINSS